MNYSTTKIYEAKLTRKVANSNGPNAVLLAHVLFYEVPGDNGRIDRCTLLLSDAVKEGGSTELNASIMSATAPPFCVLNEDQWQVDVVKESGLNVRMFTCVMEAFNSFEKNKHLVVVENESSNAFFNKYYFFERVVPPKGELVHLGFIETTHGKKEVRKYTHCNKLNIFDQTSQASADIEPEDLAAYYTQ